MLVYSAGEPLFATPPLYWFLKLTKSGSPAL